MKIYFTINIRRSDYYIKKVPTWLTKYETYLYKEKAWTNVELGIINKSKKSSSLKSCEVQHLFQKVQKHWIDKLCVLIGGTQRRRRTLPTRAEARKNPFSCEGKETTSTASAMTS